MIRVHIQAFLPICRRYSAYFGNAPVVQVPGRLYPITIEYLPQQPDDKRVQGLAREGAKRKERKGAQRIDARPYLKILERIDQQFPAEERGDMLVFLSGEARNLFTGILQNQILWILLFRESFLENGDLVFSRLRAEFLAVCNILERVDQ